MRRVTIAFVVCAVLLAAGAVVAFGRTVTGTQNPQFRVTVTIRPRHPQVGQRVVATVRIVNRTERALRGEWEVTWSTPTHGIGAAVAGRLQPGVITAATYRARVRLMTPPGRYTISASVEDRRGRSHAAVHATYSP